MFTSKYITSSPDIDHCPVNSSLSEIAFIGRSNVGKSSLINAITQNHSLAKTSSTPGKTKLINFFLIDNSFYIVDLPGYGYAKTSKSNRKIWLQSISDYLSKRTQLKHIFVLLDFRHSPTSNDKEFIQWLLSHNLEFTIVATKADKLNQKETSSSLNLYQEFMKNYSGKELVITSSHNQKGLEQMRALVLKYSK